jgi:hypothetical protein
MQIIIRIFSIIAYLDMFWFDMRKVRDATVLSPRQSQRQKARQSRAMSFSLHRRLINSCRFIKIHLKRSLFKFLVDC